MNAILARTHSMLAATFALACACFACGSATDDTDGDIDNRVTVSVDTTAPLILRPGQSANRMVSITRQGFDKPLFLSAWRDCEDFSQPATCEPLPAGVTAVFSPSTVNGSVLSSMLTITAAPNTPPTDVGMFVVASGGGLAWGGFLFFVVDQPVITVRLSGSGSGTVTSNPTGIDCGSTCARSLPVGTSITLTEAPAAGSAFADWSGGCTGTGPTCSFVLSQVITVTATFSNTTPGFALALAPTLLSVPQGGNGSAAVMITRNNNYSDAVQLSVSGVPAGVTVTPNPASVAGTSQTLNVAVASSVGVGNYPLTITASGPGAAAQTATLNLAVTSAPGGSGNITLSFAACDPTQVPIWIAVQNGSGVWTQVPAGANSTFTFSVGATGGIALVNQTGTSFNTTVRYATSAELAAMAIGGVCLSSEQTGTKQLTGTVASFGPANPGYFAIALGGAYEQYEAITGPAFTLRNVAAGVRDLVATRVAVNAVNNASAVSRMVVRRGTNYADNSEIPRLDFMGSESFAPVRIDPTVNNLGSDAVAASVALVTEFGTSAPFYSSQMSTTTLIGARYFALPSDQIRPSDFHLVTLFATPTPQNPTSLRFLAEMLHAPAARTLTLGPAMNSPTVTTLGAATPLRFRAQVASQSAYNAAATAAFDQPDRSVNMIVTAAYLGGVPATWTLDIPDLTNGGYSATWGLKSGTTVDWTVSVFGGSILPFFGAPHVDGALVTGAQVGSSANALRSLLTIPKRQ